MSVPPHLPRPSCNVESHRRMQRIKLILAAAVFGLISGMSGASIILGWVWPNFVGVSQVASSPRYTDFQRGALDSKVLSEVEEKMATVYREQSLSGAISYFNPENKIGDAIFVSSDGWMVMYSPAFDGSYRGWKVLFRNGAISPVTKAIKDNHTNLVYFKTETLSGAQSKVASFSDPMRQSQSIFVLENGEWRQTFVKQIYPQPLQDTHLDTAPSQIYSIPESFSQGSLAINDQGRVAGFSYGDNKILPSYYAERVLPGVLGKGKIEYKSLGTYGWYSEEKPLIYKNERQRGFAVVKVAVGSQLRSGDILLEINGQIVNSESLWYNISSNESVKIKALRKGKEIELEQKVISAGN